MDYEFFADTTTSIDKQALIDYFDEDGRYIQEDGLDGYHYHNTDTDVEFYFYFLDTTNIPEGYAQFPFAFRMNSFGPKIYAHEVFLAIEHFATHFSLIFYDGNSQDNSVQPFNYDNFMIAWSACSQTRIQSFLDQDLRIIFFPTPKLVDIWRWNYLRSSRTADLQDDLYIPLVQIFHEDQQVKTAIVWPDAIPMYIPQVDFILVMCIDFAPGDEEYFARLEWAELEPYLKKYANPIDDNDGYYMMYDEPPSELVELSKNAPAIQLETYDKVELTQMYDQN